MNIKLMEDTLLIHVNNDDEIRKLKEKTFALLNEYDIHNIVLHIMNSDFYDSRKFDAFLHSFHLKSNANLIIK